MLKTDQKRGWHGLPSTAKLNREPFTPVVDGVPLRAGQESQGIRTCGNGMHASARVGEVLRFCPKEEGTLLCRVIVTGELRHDDGKFAGRERVVLAMVPFDPILEPIVVKYTHRYVTSVGTKGKRGTRFQKALDAFKRAPALDTYQALAKVTTMSQCGILYALTHQSLPSRARDLIYWLGSTDSARMKRALEAAARKAIGAVV